MKAVILSAGKGIRLKPITDNVPKVMVEINGKPLLQYHIEWLAKNGIRDIGVNLHHRPNVIKDYFGDGGDFGVNLYYSFESKILGTSGGFKNFEKENNCQVTRLKDGQAVSMVGDKVEFVS